ncbi:hypothetical protein [Nostoc sp.]|uniref:hypothetical protein n=1 Tax=Nostoc sp. TaxID=1180 RepID=UPI002FFA0B97
MSNTKYTSNLKGMRSHAGDINQNFEQYTYYYYRSCTPTATAIIPLCNPLRLGASQFCNYTR